MRRNVRRPARRLIPRHTLRVLALSAGFALPFRVEAAASAADTTTAALATPEVNAAAASTLPPAARGTTAAAAAAADTQSCARPVIKFNRWQEDWTVLSRPCVPKQPFDSLKYMALLAQPAVSLSLGAGLRERFEMNNAPLFGTGTGRDDYYGLQRAEVHGDLRIGSQVQVFVQLDDARPFGKNSVSVVDKNPVDLAQAFVAVTQPVGDGLVKFRVGRQEMAFDLQRFISVRDGPNVRQAFDAVWGDYEIGPWRWIAYASQPVQYRDVSSFDDVSNRDLTFSGVRFERQGVGPGDLSGYYSRYNRTNARFLDATGDEHRDVYDLRYSGTLNHVDWDVEAMLQSGHVGDKTIGAWAIGSMAGYTLAAAPWTPRIGLQVDTASGDRHPGDGRIGTFNPLFPNGYYFSLAGYTGYTNLIHIKPSLTLKPSNKLTLMAALGLQWRQTTADAVYAQGSAVVPNTAGHGDLWTGFYTQLRADWQVNANLTAALEAVHFQVGSALRNAGARNADYIGTELKFGW